MMKIQPLSKQPIYLQVVEQIEGRIVSGKWTPETRLPSVRALANDLLINPNTVAKAYAELEERGFVVKRDRSGVFVADNASPFRRRETKRRLTEAADRFVSAGEQLGLSGPDLGAALGGALQASLERTSPAEDDDVPEDETDPDRSKAKGTGIVTAHPAPVEIRGLSRTFGTHKALDRVSLEIPPGVVLGLVGQNGAGKTTLIHHILGLLRAEEGDVRVFGLDPVRSPEAALSKIGTLSEERDLPGWMRIEELLNYTRAFYPNWDDALAQRLSSQFELDSSQKVSTLSRGQHVRVGLVLALAPRPPLLVLDEPSSGLDPVVRRDVLQTVLRVAVAEERTVLFSSHLLDEVERISDHLALLEAGSLRFAGPLEEVLAMHRRLILDSVALPELPGQASNGLAGVLQAEVIGRETHIIFRGDVTEAASLLGHTQGTVCDEGEASLEEIFHAYTSSSSGSEGAEAAP